jgi:hypothetical protein
MNTKNYTAGSNTKGPIDFNTKFDLSKIGSINSSIKDFCNENKSCDGVKKSDGMTCKRCKNFSPMSEPNQRDGSFLCWSCRSVS